VKFAGHKANGYGIHIDVDHGYGFVTKYAHLSKLKVKPGQKIKRGQVIGLSGNTGQSAGPHLHYEVVRDGRKINPVNHLIKGVTPEEFLKLKKAAQIENTSWD
jgi:murein DD-endopeptidase MepM/ murein hydrolase activator NlpD